MVSFQWRESFTFCAWGFILWLSITRSPAIRESMETLNKTALFYFCISAAASFLMWKLAASLTGAGHGHYSFYLFAGAPYGYYFWIWPFYLLCEFQGKTPGFHRYRLGRSTLNNAQQIGYDSNFRPVADEP
jgi:hypothetical protein